MEALLGVPAILAKDGSIVDVKTMHLRHSYVMLYFGSGLAPQCRAFNQTLVAFYEKHHVEKRFEIIYVSLDFENEDAFARDYATHPWPAIRGFPAHLLMDRLKVFGVPAISIYGLEGGDGRQLTLVTNQGRQSLADDPYANNFPWRRREFR